MGNDARGMLRITVVIAANLGELVKLGNPSLPYQSRCLGASNASNE